MDYILRSTKKLSGLGFYDDSFDDELIPYINSVFLVLKQLGVGPSEGFVVSAGTGGLSYDKWTDFIPDDAVLRESVKSYMSAKVKLQFDPPTSSVVADALYRTINEFEWRLREEAELIADGKEGIQNGE